MKKLILSLYTALLFSCSTEDCTEPVNSECEAYNAEVNANYNYQVEYYLQNHPNPDIEFLIMLHQERMEYLNSDCQ